MLVDKPAGPTSHDVVDRVRRAFRTRSVGHAGTLDPFATGLLVVLVGQATRLARFVSGQPKTYLATARLGFATTTDDLLGEPLETDAGHAAPRPVSDPDLAAALAGFQGAQRQRPPAFSAKHVDGERSYRLARRGAAVTLPEADVIVHAIELVRRDGDLVTFRATVSAGTYLRGLARDLGERLGTGAHLVSLRRESIGALQVAAAVSLDELDEQGTATALLEPSQIVAHLPAREVGDDDARSIAHGRALPAEGPDLEAVAVVQGGRLLAIAAQRDGWLRPGVVLAAG